MLEVYKPHRRRSWGVRGGDRPPNKNSAGREYLFAPPRMVLDLRAAIFCAPHLNISCTS